MQQEDGPRKPLLLSAAPSEDGAESGGECRAEGVRPSGWPL